MDQTPSVREEVGNEQDLALVQNSRDTRFRQRIVGGTADDRTGLAADFNAGTMKRLDEF